MGKKQVDKNPTIYIDDREPRYILEQAKYIQSTDEKGRWDEFDIKSAHLKSADLIYGKLAAERKEVNDAIASIRDGRIFEQMYIMSDNFDHVYLLLSGNLDNLYISQIKSIYTTIADAEMRYGIRTRFCYNDDILIYYFMMLAYKLNKGVQPRLDIRRPPSSVKDERVKMLMGIKGVGKKTARRFIGEFKSIQNIANLNIESFTNLHGIGDKKANHIIEVLQDASELEDEKLARQRK